MITRKAPLALALFIAALISFVPTGRAKILDNFDAATKTNAWVDFNFGPGTGGNTQTGGQLKFSIPAVQDIFCSTAWSAGDYTVADGKAIEFRADLVSANRADAYAVLGWIPNSQSPSSLAGYSLTKSASAILLSKGINKYFLQDPTAIKNTNITLVLSLRGEGTSVVITAKILDKDANNAVIYERTMVDTAGVDGLAAGTDSPAVPYTGPGKFTLMLYEDFNTGATGTYEVVFDNAEAFAFDTAIIDDFSNGKVGWTDTSLGAGSSAVVNGQYKFSIPAIQDIFFGSTKTTRSYDFKDGEKLEFRVDLMGANRADVYAVLSWTPNAPQNVSSLTGYGFVKAPSAILISKGINRYFVQEATSVASSNVTMALSLERRGTSVVINTRLYDKGNNNAVVYDKTVIDTAAADTFAAGTDSPIAPFTGQGGFVLLDYEDFNTGATGTYDVIFDNAWVASPPLPANVPPTISDVTPENFRNFLPGSTNITFKITDDAPVSTNKVAVIVNGVRFTSANGLAMTTNGNIINGSLGGLTTNKTYTATIEAVDAGNLTNQTTIFFDTFATNTFLIETEDYNFAYGLYIDNPVLVQNGDFNDFGYRGEQGGKDTDYFNTRGATVQPYRPDLVTQAPTLDFERWNYLALGGKTNNYIDYDTGRNRAGEWQRYTRTFPAGTYEVYLRESFLNVNTAVSVLEKVNGEPWDTDATLTLLGSFIGQNSGASYRNTPLTDSTGQSIATVTFDGVTTVRLRHIDSEPSGGTIRQNYLVFIPTAPVINRPGAISLSPAARSTVSNPDVSIAASLQDRDTTVVTNTVELFINNVKVSPAISSPSAGVTAIAYTMTTIPASGSTVDASIRFTDSANVRVTNNWSFSVVYPFLLSSNRVAGAQNSGFNIHIVQSPSGTPLGDSVVRAEDQLAANSTMAEAYDLVTNATIINFNQTAGGSAGYFPNDDVFPGLDTMGDGNDYFAMEATAFLDLPAGIVRFGINCDDGFKISSGASLSDPSPVLAILPDNPADLTVDVVVPAAGLYPFRLVWYEQTGGAHLEFFTVNRTTGARTLINSATAGAIKAYQTAVAPTITVYSASDVGAQFTLDASATVNTSAGTVTIAKSGGAKFYVIRSGSQLKVLSTAIQGNNVVLTYGAP
jgi:hypothetical protein